MKRFLVVLLLLCVAGGPSLATASGATVTYIYTDGQGSPVAEADSAGNITATYDYTPFGSTLLGTPKNGPGYTGHVSDPDTALTYMQARYYDPSIGQFLSVDPVIPAAGRVSSFSAYTYADNNPTTRTDPDGRYTCAGTAAFCGKIDSYVGGLQHAKDALGATRNAGADERLVAIALRQIGPKGKDGPTYVEGSLAGRASANTNQEGTTTVDTAKLDARGDKAVQAGAQAIGHEARHDYDVKTGGPKATESEVRETETNAYNTSRAVDRGFGEQWTRQQFKEAVDASVDSWKSRQPSPEQPSSQTPEDPNGH